MNKKKYLFKKKGVTDASRGVLCKVQTVESLGEEDDRSAYSEVFGARRTYTGQRVWTNLKGMTLCIECGVIGTLLFVLGIVALA
jgi:hypothetical protein